jgi:hypothetical protein
MKKTDINQRLQLLGQLIMRPIPAWKTIFSSGRSVTQFQFEFMYPAMLVFFVAQLIGMLIDTNVGIISTGYIMIYSVLFFVALFLSYQFSVWFMLFFVRAFEIKCKPENLRQLIGFPLIIAYIPMAVVALFHSMFFLFLLSFYAVIVYRHGIKRLIRLNPEQFNVFGILSVVFILGIHIVVFFFLITFKNHIISII